MTTIDDLKKAILYAEKCGHIMELYGLEDPKLCDSANNLRIAAACMWEKLERLESEGVAHGSNENC